MRVPFEVLAEGLNHPEGVAWNPADGRVYAGGEEGEIYAASMDGDVEELCATGGSMLGLAIDGCGRVYACDSGNGDVVRWDPATGRIMSYAGGGALDTPNAMAFAPDGALYVTCSGEEGDPVIVRIAPGGEAERWCEALSAYPNGCCVTPDGSALLVVESHRPGVSRVPILPDRAPGDPVTVAELPDTDPDGVALAEDGSMFVTLYRPDGILRIAADGSVTTAVDDHLAQTFDAPTNIAFVGPRLERAVVANVGDRFLSIGDLGIRGQPLHYPEVP